MHPVHLATKRHLPRRTFLKGIGCALSLPLLEAMTPAFLPAAVIPASQPPRRFVALCATLGFHGPYFTPRTTGRDYALTPYLEPLAALRDDFTVFSGLSHPEQNGDNGHASSLSWLTAARHPGLPGFKNTISLDQYIARQLGPVTRFPSLALTTGEGTLAWTPSGAPLPADNSPARVFQQLFARGTPDQLATQRRELARGHSILDTVRLSAQRLHRDLGHADQEKLDEYLTAIRDLEQNLQENAAWIDRPKPLVNVPTPVDIPDKKDVIGRTRLMQDLIVLALQTDSTRSLTLRLDGFNQVPTIDGVTQDWHGLSHHGLDQAKIEELKLIELAEFQSFATFLTRLKTVQENGAPLLNHTTVLFGSNLGNASAHDWRNLPILLAGGGYHHGQHLAFDPKNNLPLSNLFVHVAQRIGLPCATFGTSTSQSIPGLS